MKDQETAREKAGYITSKDTIENVYPGLILAINSVRQGMETKIFYTFMGLNALWSGPKKTSLPDAQS